MKTYAKILIGVPVTAALAAGCGVGYLSLHFPSVAPPASFKVATTPQLVQRGEYLVRHRFGCIGCHSERDWSRYTGPIKPGTEGQGGEVFDESKGLPGVIYARNITPAGIGRYTDGELLRAMTVGVTREGEPLFPLMPYPNLAQASREDLEAAIAYIRTLRPVKNPVPPRHLDFPMNLLVKTMPHDVQLREKAPTPADGVEYGRYIVTTSSCGDCHTQRDHGTPVAGMEYAGGFEFPMPGRGIVRSANITPDRDTGIGNWTREAFIARFKAMDGADRPFPVGPKDFNSQMPWTEFAGMTETDLGAIYDYLRTLKPVNNRVVKFTPAEAVASTP
jgi:mono/diheme cytochrome c family protein